MPNSGSLDRDELARRLDGVVDRRRIAGAVRQEDAVGLQREHLGAGVVAGTTVTRQPTSRSRRRMFALDAEVVGDDVVALGRRSAALARRGGPPAGLVPLVAARGRSPRGTRSRPSSDGCLRARARPAPRRRSSTARVMSAALRAAVADAARERARVDARDARDAVLGAAARRAMPGRASSTPRGDSSRTTKPGAPRARRLEVLGVDADVADLGRGHGDDLPAVRRIGQHLLVAGDRGVEDDLAGAVGRRRRSRSRGRRCRLPARAARAAAVGRGRRLTSRWFSSSGRCVRRRPSARRDRAASDPRNGVLRDLRAQRRRRRSVQVALRVDDRDVGGRARRPACPPGRPKHARRARRSARATSAAGVSAPGADQLQAPAAARSRGRSCRRPPARTRRPSRPASAARDRWRCTSMVPSASASRSAADVGGGAQRRVALGRVS